MQSYPDGGDENDGDDEGGGGDDLEGRAARTCGRQPDVRPPWTTWV